jgi:hypothetical protein
VRTNRLPIARDRSERVFEPHADVVAVTAFLELRDVQAADARLHQLRETARVDSQRAALLAVGNHAQLGQADLE